MKIAIVGCGEVGGIYARAAREVFDVELCDSFASPAAEKLADEFGVELHAAHGQWTSGVSQVWACVTGDAALDAVAEALEFLESGAAYVDLSTASADDKREAAALCASKGVSYVDVAIMGAVGLAGAKTNLLLAGNSSEVASAFELIGAKVSVLDGSEPGDAITLKLLRTVLTKGLEALGAEALIAAEAQGVRDGLYKVLADIDEAGFTAFLNTVVTSHVTHAERKLHEVDRAVAQLKDNDLPSSVIAATKSRYAQTVQARAETPPNPAESETIDGAVKWLLRTSRGQ